MTTDSGATLVRPHRLARAVTVPPSFFGLNAPVITSPCRLVGWSLLGQVGNSDGLQASAQGVAAATTTLTLNGFNTLGSVLVSPAAAWPAGANVVTINNVNGGPVLAQIPGGTTQPVLVTFSPAANPTGVPTVVVPAIVGGPAYTINASGAGSGSGGPGIDSAAEIMDGGQVVGIVGCPAGVSDTKWLEGEGAYVGTSLALNVLNGEVFGCLYIVDDWHGGSN